MSKLNPNEAPKGYIAVRGGDCFKCAFCNKPTQCAASNCLPFSREDGCSVHFIKGKSRNRIKEDAKRPSTEKRLDDLTDAVGAWFRASPGPAAKDAQAKLWTAWQRELVLRKTRETTERKP